MLREIGDGVELDEKKACYFRFSQVSQDPNWLPILDAFLLFMVFGEEKRGIH